MSVPELVESQSTLTAGELGRSLYRWLYRLASDPGRWIMVVEDDRRRYVQVLVYGDGSLRSEVVSNKFLRAEDRWTPRDEAALLSLGWGPPLPPKCPNWHMAPEATGVSKSLHLAALIVCTLRSPFNLGDEDRLDVHVFRSRLSEVG